MDQNSKDSTKNKRVFFSIIISIVITTLVVGSSVYFWQKSVSSKEKEEAINNFRQGYQQQVIELQNEIEILQKSSGERISSSEAQKIIEDKTDEVILAIKNKDMENLSTYINQDKGIRFSPYSHIDVCNDLAFTVDQIKNISKDTNEYSWGVYDGSGLPIKLTFEGYFKKFVYDQDFANAKEVSYNQILGKGNTINNEFEVYSNSIIVEYYFSGFDPKYEGMDWESLRLVYEEKDNTWYLTAIIHDQWTI
jgi:hypothetical protein